MTLLSVLDLAPIAEGSDASQSFKNTLDLARHADAVDACYARDAAASFPTERIPDTAT